MFLTLIAVFAAGFAGAGLAMALRFSFKALPKWIVPLFAGGAMIAATISTEYTWYNNTSDSLPEGMEVIATREHSAWWQPWSFVRPYTDGFIALDTASARDHAELPDVQLVNLYVYGRWAAITEVPMAVNCVEAQQMTLIDLPDLSPEALESANWVALREDDPLNAALCEGSTG